MTNDPDSITRPRDEDMIHIRVELGFSGDGTRAVMAVWTEYETGAPDAGDKQTRQPTIYELGEALRKAPHVKIADLPQA